MSILPLGVKRNSSREGYSSPLQDICQIFSTCFSNIFNIFQIFSKFSNISILLNSCQIFLQYFLGRNTPLLAKIKFQYSWTSLIFLLLHIFNYFQMFQYSCRSLICFCLHIFQLLSNILILKCLNIFQIFEKIFPKNLP